MERFLKLALIVLIPVILWFTTPPEGLTDTAWRLFGFYIAGILGLILKPYPIQIILLAVLSASALFLDNAKEILVGYGSTALWMIIAAFSLSVAFGKTGLGHRVAYHLIRAFGSTVLRLGYVTALLDLILSPQHLLTRHVRSVLFIRLTYPSPNPSVPIPAIRRNVAVLLS